MGGEKIGGGGGLGNKAEQIDREQELKAIWNECNEVKKGDYQMIHREQRSPSLAINFVHLSDDLIGQGCCLGELAQQPVLVGAGLHVEVGRTRRSTVGKVAGKLRGGRER